MTYIIIGGGLSGLYMAYRCQQKNQDYLLLEAGSALGGRAAGWKIQDNWSLELGATWYWDDFQTEFVELIEELNIENFSQPIGKTIYDLKGESLSVINRPYSAGRRLVGGMSRLIDELYKRLDSSKVLLNQAVTSISLTDKVHVTTPDDTFVADAIFLAIPPRIAVETIHFSPSLPLDIEKDWSAQETWMAPHAKFLFTFSRPFWRELGFSGDIISNHGVMAEIHDISSPEGDFGALFGFASQSYQERKEHSIEDCLSASIKQLERYFGHRISKYLQATYYKDWSADSHIARPADWTAKGHQFKSASNHIIGPWQSRLIGISSEFSPTFPGFLAGAIESVNIAQGNERDKS
ncbi:TPA: flavin monoamine oxidase family protein [Streptococcus suis]